MAVRKIIHCDCDCFYAAVEMRDDSRLRNLPLAIGGQPGQRGVIATCNYPARKFGVRSAMPTSQAIRRCPNLVVLPPNMEKYREVSRQIFSIYREYTDLVEPLSLDEAYLDVSNSPMHYGSATRIAEEIRYRVATEVGVTVSAGVANSKFLAKIASDWNKPDGLFVILPDEVDTFVETLPVSKLHGVGQVTAEKFNKLGIQTCADLRAWSLPDLMRQCGKAGHHFYLLSRGIDEREVTPHSERKSLSVEETFNRDIPDLTSLQQELLPIYLDLERRIQRAGIAENIQKLYLKLRFSDFKITTIECLGRRIQLEQFQELLITAFNRRKLPVRLLGLGVRVQNDEIPEQLRFPDF